ncbi:MAG: hypothetical protein SNG35_04660 [Rikenellaceae bacterium]
MKLLNHFTNSRYVPRIGLITSIFIILATVTMSYKSRYPEGVELIANSQTSLYFKHFDATKTINRGERVTFMGFDDEASLDGNKLGQIFWVTTSKGERGYVLQEDFLAEAVVRQTSGFGAKNIPEELSSLKRGDRVSIVAREIDGLSVYYTVRAADGSQGKLHSKSLYNDISIENFEYKVHGQVQGKYYLSLEKFESEYVGSSFLQAEQLYRRADFIMAMGSTTEALFPLYVIDKEAGVSFSPVIKYQNGEYLSYERAKEEDLSFVVGWIPFLNKIIDSDLLSRIISQTSYTTDFDLNFESTTFTVIFFILLPFGLLAIFMWFILTATLPARILAALTYLRFPLIFVSNKMLYRLALLLTLPMIYLWTVMMIVYGVPWWIAIPVNIWFSKRFLSKFYDFCDDYPSLRCPKCKSLYRIEWIDEEIVGNHQEWGEVVVKGAMIDSNTTESTSWTNVTTRTMRGGTEVSSSTRREDVTDHRHLTETYKMDVYKVLYDVDEMENIYQCKCCKHEQRTSFNDPKEVDRQFSHSFTKDETRTFSTRRWF